MAILTDGTHLISTKSEEELHEFARKIGLKRKWFQDHKSHPHYDMISKHMRDMAERHGAEFCSSRLLVKANYAYADVKLIWLKADKEIGCEREQVYLLKILEDRPNVMLAQIPEDGSGGGGDIFEVEIDCVE